MVLEGFVTLVVMEMRNGGGGLEGGKGCDENVLNFLNWENSIGNGTRIGHNFKCPSRNVLKI